MLGLSAQDDWDLAASAAARHPLAASAPVDLWSVHGPLRHPLYWVDTFKTALLLHSPPTLTHHLIIGADWNSLPNPQKDSLHGTPGSIPWTAVAPALEAHDLVDILRLLQPDAPVFTRFSLLPNKKIRSAKRLDSIWTSKPLSNLAVDCRFGDTASDHRAASVTFFIALPPAPPTIRPWTRWTLHPGCLRSPLFRNAITDFTSHVPPPSDPMPGPQLITTWTNYERRLRAVCQSQSRLIGRTMVQARLDRAQLENSLETLDLTRPEHAAQLAPLLDALHIARLLSDDSFSLTVTNSTQAHSFRSSSWLAESYRRTGSDSIPSILGPSGAIVTALHQRLDATFAFYSSLYTPLPDSDRRRDCTALLLHTARTRFPDAATSSLAQAYTAKEMLAAISSARIHSSPGPNGLTYPLLIMTADPTCAYLAHLANGLCAAAPFRVTLRTTLIHKKRTPLRPGELPPHFGLGPAFLPGRRTATIAGALQGIIDCVGSNRPNTPTSIFSLSLDQQKAYDRVDHRWMLATMTAARAPAPFLNLLCSLYGNASTQYVIDGHLTDFVSIRSGLLQGDSLSCCIYNIALQPFLDFLNAQGLGVFIPHLGLVSALAFADDVVLLLPGGDEGARQWPLILQALQIYEEASGARLNRSKCGFFTAPAHPNPPSTNALFTTLTQAGFRHLTAPNNDSST
ncbi:hypothetical protein A4X03_0g2485 [Tilletia caries]|uniref:Reverse transcriptase domain-containing protein n=1 Tax=Tilletia caries TaxID=13290 RepID=A0A8T8TN36_9BASI|nr:hypothetical protein A4X03_0g2485 [Tilletia caries]